MKLWLCLTMLSSVTAVQDMTGKVFVFPEETDSAHVKLNTGQDSFDVVTFCHRSFTDLRRSHALLSLATPSQFNEALTFYDASANLISTFFSGTKIDYGSLDYTPNKWHSMCVSWCATSGMRELWFDGRPLSKKYAGHTGPAFTQPMVILGQDQDGYGGGFDAKQSFVGRMTDVHMWDHELSACEIQSYMDDLNFTPGNKINWGALDFETHGNVLVEDKKQGCDSKWIK